MAESLNVLFFAIDDLRPQLHGYVEVQMHTPHLDRLAAEGNRLRAEGTALGVS
ncbi:MAG: hypothetical protein IH994_00950 [Proteobacteria bacterium]|nr:hypothetical protein [Pseudomonadota bacterium]